MSAYSEAAKKMAKARPAIACEGKDGFDSQVIAAQIARKSNRRKDGDVSEYRCGHCGRWHIGGSSIKARNRLNRAFKNARNQPIEDEVT